ncbi:MAG TPA: phosphoribosyltransferase [Acidimicrobiales bacterium]|nr:phosphoribosyltransferase [Acidimicrobiales bacterium]
MSSPTPRSVRAVHTFADRVTAGRALGAALLDYQGPGTVVLGLPRGGVPVAAEVADALGAPLDVFVVRKLGVPGHEELAMGAIASGGVVVLNEEVMASLGIDQATLEAVIDRERGELARRERAYRGDRPPLALAGRTVVLVDDGLATGASMRAAVEAVRRAGPDLVVAAVPVGAAATCVALSRVADRVVCLVTPEPFNAVGAFYADFSQTTEQEVRTVLDRLGQPLN